MTYTVTQDLRLECRSVVDMLAGWPPTAQAEYLAQSVASLLEAHRIETLERAAAVADTYMDEPRWADRINIIIATKVTNDVAATIRNLRGKSDE